MEHEQWATVVEWTLVFTSGTITDVNGNVMGRPSEVRTFELKFNSPVRPGGAIRFKEQIFTSINFIGYDILSDSWIFEPVTPYNNKKEWLKMCNSLVKHGWNEIKPVCIDGELLSDRIIRKGSEKSKIVQPVH